MVKFRKEQNTEEKILSAAKKVFLKEGMAGARMQDIADEAGINKAMLHYYFRNKEKLFEVIFREAAAKLFPKLNMVFESDLSLFEKIERFTVQYIDVILENPYLPLFVLNEIHRDPEAFLTHIWQRENMPRPEKFLDQIEREIKKGNIKRISPLQLLLNLISLCIFPFMARPMFQIHLGVDDLQFRNLMQQRKTEVPRFIIDAIRK